MTHKSSISDLPRATKDESIYLVELYTENHKHEFPIRVEYATIDFKPQIEKFANAHNITNYEVACVSWLGNSMEGQILIDDPEYKVYECN